jgi:hypothetical protein
MEIINGATAPTTVSEGGTGATTLTDGEVLLGDGTNPITTLSASAIGKLLVDQGSGSDPAYEYKPLPNLFPNSGWGVWSHSNGPHNVGSQVTLTDVTNGVCSTGDTQDLAVGKLFKFDAGDFSGNTYMITALTADTSFTVHDTSISDSGTPGTGYEVTPGCTAADALGPDGWEKTSTLDVYRQHNDATLTKDGSFYSLKVVKGSNDPEYIWWSSTSHDKSTWYTQFLGKTMVMSAYVYSVTATDNVKPAIYRAGAWFTGTVMSTADAWTWLSEHSQTITDTSTDVRFGFCFDGDSGDVAYISHPILIEGETIGEGNYNPIPYKEWVFTEDSFMLANFNGTAYSDVAVGTTINMEAESLGRIPKEAEAIHGIVIMRDSGSAGGNVYFRINGLSNGIHLYWNIGNAGLAMGNDLYFRDTFMLVLDENGECSYKCQASGAGTLDMTLEIFGVLI